MQITQLSSIPDSVGNYVSQVKDACNYYTLNLPGSITMGAGSVPAGLGGTSNQIFLPTLVQPKLLKTVDGKQSSTPIVTTQQGDVNDYKFDSLGNVLGSNSPAMENIVLCLKTGYDTSSIDNFGLQSRPIIPQNFQNIISADIRKAIQPVIDSGLLDPSTLTIGIKKKGSSIFAHIQFTDTQSKQTVQTAYTLR